MQARYPNPEEIAEINNMISKRAPEITNSISSDVLISDEYGIMYHTAYIQGLKSYVIQYNAK